VKLAGSRPSAPNFRLFRCHPEPPDETSLSRRSGSTFSTVLSCFARRPGLAVRGKPVRRAIHALRSPCFAVAPAQAFRGLGVRWGEGPPDLHLVPPHPLDPRRFLPHPVRRPLLGLLPRRWRSASSRPSPTPESFTYSVHKQMTNSVPRQYSLVKSTPATDYEAQTPIEEGAVLIFFGEIPNMPGHCVVADHKTGRMYSGCHTGNFVELADDET